MQYSTLPAPDGGLWDDIIVTRLWKDGEYYVVVNAGNAQADFAWFKEQAAAYGVEVRLLPRTMLALQGPASQQILSGLTLDPQSLDGLGYYHMMPLSVAGALGLVSRSGYTGEDGFELCLQPEDTLKVWEAIFAAGAAHSLQPIGLGARNILRLEMGYALYGHEIDRNTSPLEAGLDWVVKLEKGDFIGREQMLAVKAKGLSRRLAGFEMVDKGVARDGYPVVDAQGARIGKVTSGSPSPALGRNIGMAFLPPEQCALGTEFLIQVRDKALKAKVVSRPFVEPKVRKN
jgi:aminomethyltransferase